MYPFIDLHTPCPLELFVLSCEYFAVLCIEDGAHILKIFKLNISGVVDPCRLRSSLSPAPKTKDNTAVQQRTYFILIDKIFLQNIESRIIAVQPLGYKTLWLNRSLVLDFLRNDELKIQLNQLIKKRIIDDKDFIDVVKTYQVVTSTQIDVDTLILD